MVHHSTAKLDELVTKLLNFFNDHFVPGEEAVGSVEGHLMPCKVLRAVDEQGDDVDLDAGKGPAARSDDCCQASALQRPAGPGRPGALQTGVQAGICFPSGKCGALSSMVAGQRGRSLISQVLPAVEPSPSVG